MEFLLGFLLSFVMTIDVFLSHITVLTTALPAPRSRHVVFSPFYVYDARCRAPTCIIHVILPFIFFSPL